MVILWSNERIVVIIFRNSIYVVHTLVELIIDTIYRRQILVYGLIYDLELPIRSILGSSELGIPLLFELILTSDSKLIFKHLLSGSTVVSLLVSRFHLCVPQIDNFLVHNLL